MRVSSGAEWTLPSGNRRTHEVGFDADDGAEIVKGWVEMSFTQRLVKLRELADLAVLDYVHSEGGLSDEYYHQRIAEIRSRG